MKFSLILFFGIVILSNCHDELNITEDPSKLFSRWNWEISSGGIAGTSYTPESTGDNIRIEFTHDSMYREYLNNQLVFETGFQVIRSESIYSTETTLVIVYDDRSVRQSYEIGDNNLLTLYDEVYDGFVHKYKRSPIDRP